MELKKLKDIEKLHNNKTKLYVIQPHLRYDGMIVANTVYRITTFWNYSYSCHVYTNPKSKGIILMYRSWREEKTDNDVINTGARVFDSKEEAEIALKEHIKVLSYNALEKMDKRIKELEAKIKKEQENIDKIKTLRKQYYEASIKRFKK